MKLANYKKIRNLSGQSLRTSMRNLESVAQKMAELQTWKKQPSIVHTIQDGVKFFEVV